jgi:hypothetical protein
MDKVGLLATVGQLAQQSLVSAVQCSAVQCSAVQCRQADKGMFTDGQLLISVGHKSGRFSAAGHHLDKGRASLTLNQNFQEIISSNICSST